MSKRTLQVCAALVFVIPAMAYAQSMQSSSYKIQSDSVNLGGVKSTSASYLMEDTLGEVATGMSSSTSYTMSAGYQQMVSPYISITSPTDISLANLNGLNGDSQTGSTAWTVTTDNPAGYSLTVAAATSPALKSSLGFFSDYTPATGNPDYNFTVLAASSTFGFSPEGTDIAARFKDDGVSCNTGALDTADKCWVGFSTTPILVDSRSSANTPSGTLTTLKLRADNGVAHIQESGTYSVSISVTAVTL